MVHLPNITGRFKLQFFEHIAHPHDTSDFLLCWDFPVLTPLVVSNIQDCAPGTPAWRQLTSYFCRQEQTGHQMLPTKRFIRSLTSFCLVGV